MTESEAQQRLARLRARAEAEKATRATFKARRDYGLTRRHHARLAMLSERAANRTEAEQTRN